MTGTPELFEYDVALSFAKEDKVIAGQLADLLASRNVSVFRDEYKSPLQTIGEMIWSITL